MKIVSLARHSVISWVTRSSTLGQDDYNRNCDPKHGTNIPLLTVQVFFFQPPESFLPATPIFNSPKSLPIVSYLSSVAERGTLWSVLSIWSIWQLWMSCSFSKCHASFCPLGGTGHRHLRSKIALILVSWPTGYNRPSRNADISWELNNWTSTSRWSNYNCPEMT